MDEYSRGNLDLWNEITPIHIRSEFYDLPGFKAGKSSLKSIELAEVGEVKGKSLLHLQCHFGMDTLSWARLGAHATGVDFSEAAVSEAQSLSSELGLKANFVCCDIYDLPRKLSGSFDVVYTSYGVLCWLSDLPKWAAVIAHFLKSGGMFYIVEGHPVLNVFDNSSSARELNVAWSYFHTKEPIKWEPEGDYTDSDVKVEHSSYEWTHSLSDIINALIGAGLKIEFLHEFPMCSFRWAPFAKQDSDGWWRVEGDRVPLTFSIKATKPNIF